MTTRPDLLPRRLRAQAGIEPPLGEVLSDPLIHQIMRRDGVGMAELLRVITEARLGLRKRLCLAA